MPAGTGPGWYLATCRSASGAAFGAPVWLQCLEPDGSPLTGAVASLPTPGRPGEASAMLILPERPLAAVRLTTGAGDRLAPIDGLALRPLSRPAVARRLFATLLGLDGARAALSAGLALVLSAAKGQLPAGLAALARRYRQSLKRAALGPSGQTLGSRWQVTLGSLSGPPVAVGLGPIHHLRLLEDEPGRSRWLATGDDPRLLLSPADLEGPLPAGWYIIEGRVQTHAGRVLSPCLYPDYGRGHEHSSLILLPDPDPDGVIQSLVLLKYPVASLRFDPSTRRCEFSLERFSLRRASRASALSSMLAEVSRERGRWSARAAWRHGADFLLRLVREGSTSAGERLFGAYRDARRQGASSYQTWIRLHDVITAADEARMRERAQALTGGPLISVLVPVYETPLDLLRFCIDSVRAQAYGNWELCIADDASPSQGVRDFLLAQARLDPRIRVSFREHNGHISEASNTALAMARGEFVALLDHDDELRPHALLEVAEALVARPELELVYSDEDKIDAEGQRNQPYFKPDWNPDLLRSQNYLCHLTTIRTARARAVGGFRAGFEGSQDHDLFLRCTEGLRDDQIHHIPRILYHWRAVAGSTALDRGSKDYAADAGARAVGDHLARTGTGATVEQLPHGHYRVRWPVPTPAPRVSLVIPTRDRADLLRTCVQSILTLTRYPAFELVIVDNQSRDPEALEYLASLAAEPRVRILRYDDEFNYSAINNFAVATCDGELVGLVNNDIEVISPDWLDEMAGHALRHDVGAVGAMLYYPDDTIQHAGVILGLGGVANHAYIHQPRHCPGHGARAMVAQDLSAVTAACLVVRRAVFQQVGGLDETLQVAFNDIDFCLRLRQAGYLNVWTPFAELYHHESATRGGEDTASKQERFRNETRIMLERWGPLLGADPAYNPNLSLDGFCSELAFPPRH